MKIHLRTLLGFWLLLVSLLSVRAATYKGTITLKVGETTRVNIGTGYMGSDVITSGYWDKSNSTFIIESVSGMYHKECTIRGNKVGSGKLYWTGAIFGDDWEFYWDVNVVAATPSLTLTTNPDGGVVSRGDFVKFVATPNEDWVEIWYTLDGSDPKNSSTSIMATSTRGFTITNSCTLKAYASAMFSNGTYNDSEVITKYFTIASTPQKKRTIHLEEPGTLSQYISEDDKYSITDLTLSGVINGSDLRLLRHMAGMSHLRDANTALIVTNGRLSVLDIRDVTFVKGGDWYIEVYGTNLYTKDSKDLPDYAFAWCPRLEKIYLPRESTKLNYFALHWLENLNEVELPTGLTSIEKNFIKCTNLKSLSIPSGVESVDKECFSTYGEPGGLTEVRCYAIEPPSVNSSFPSNLKKATLYVPQNSQQKYQQATGWKDFNKIIANLDARTYVAKIVLNVSESSLQIGETKQLSATITPSNATDKSVTWSSSKTSVATVSSSGLVTAVAEGTATITCKANDGSGVSETCQVTVTSPIVAEINATNFPDANFRNWLLKASYGEDGVITESERDKVTIISVDEKNISSLKGIEYFTALTELSCEKNKLTSLDLSNNIKLIKVSCNNNMLTRLDISKNTKLETLYCYSNKLGSLDLSKNTALTFINCYGNGLSTIDVSKNVNLEGLYCQANNLTALDVSQNTKMTRIGLHHNKIKGAAMDKLIASLPVNTTEEKYSFYVVSDNDVFSGMQLEPEGNVCTKVQVAALKAKGWTATTNGGDYEGSDETSATKGDVNGDGQVNGTDYVALTNIVLGKNAKTDAADVNGDGQVNGTDYVALVNIVLGRSQAPRRAATDAARLSIDPSFDIKAGETKEMVINLTNPNDEITLVQFDLSLPDGLSVKQTGGEYVYDIADRTTWRKHSLEANATGGIIRFLLASNSNATLSGTEGGIITITVTADKDFSSGDIKLENILMVSPDEKETKQDTYTYTIGQTSPTPSASAVLAIEPFNIAAGGEAEMVIDLTNPSDEITLVQFDLRLPAGLSVKQTGGDYVYDIAGRTTWRKHSLDANETDGIVRFLLASSSNATLSGTEGAIITITLKADNTYKGGTVKLENILLVTPDEKEIKPADLSYTIGSTGISSITTDAIDSNTPIYNLRGQRLAAPQKGINIIGGKKVIVK